MFFRRAFWALLVGGTLLLFAVPGYTQTQRGDKPAKNQRQKRELRFKTRSKQGDKARTKDVAGRRVRTKNYSSANRAAAQYPVPKAARAGRARAGDRNRAGRPLNPIFSPGPRDNQRAWRGGPYGPRMNARPPAARNQNVYSNRSQLNLLQKMQRPPGDQGGGKRKVTPRSSSRAYMARKSVNPMARFIRKSKQGESAYMTDPAGRKLRAKNYQTPRQPVIPAGDVYHGRKRVGDRPYKGPADVSIGVNPRGAPRAWKGDVAGRRIHGRNHQSRVQTGGSRAGRLQATNPVFGDSQKHSRKKAPLFGKQSKPRIGGIGGITAKTRDNKATYRKAGKSRSGDRWNNNGQPLQGRPPAGDGVRAATFQGNAKFKRPLTPRNAGKSKSGQMWNNKGQPLNGKPPAGESARAANFQGNAKLRRPLTPGNAGKSKSGQLWNNKGQPVAGKPPALGSQRAANFQGNIKGGRPLTPRKAGKSRSGKLWNNDEKPIIGHPPSNDTRRAATFQGNVKGGRPDVPKNAGESRSGELWNNKEKPIKVTPPSLEQLANYRYKGDIRMSRFRRNYIRNPNSAEAALKKARPDKTVYRVDDVPRQVRQYQYVRNPSGSRDALKVRTPGKAFARASDYQGNIKMKKFDWLTRNDFHPDSKFVKINRNNVEGEKDALTGFRLWWAKTFKKEETQPDHLKEKIRKPRYDKGEQGLWYE